MTETDKLSRVYTVLTDEEVEAWLASDEAVKLPSERVTKTFREAERQYIEFDANGMEDDLNDNYDDITIPRLSEVLSDLVWRVVGGTLSGDIVVKYLASEEPFQKRLGAEEGHGGDLSVDPVVEVLCDTLWGVDAMVSQVLGRRMLPPILSACHRKPFASRPPSLNFRDGGMISRAGGFGYAAYRGI